MPKLCLARQTESHLATPLSVTTADILAAEMAKMNMEDLPVNLIVQEDCHENWIRYQNFCGCRKDASPACLQWSGI